MPKYQINIPEPCHEKWDEMTPTEKGKFCDVCSKEIYDMRQFTNSELANKIKQNENICGVFNQNQLGVDLYANSNSAFSRFGMLFSLTSLLSLTQPQSAQAQDTPKASTIQQCDTTKKDTKPLILGKIAAPKITLKGIVTDDMRPIPNATVLIKYSERGVVTDFDGNFEFILNNNKPVTIVVSHAAYQSKEVTISDFSQNETILIKLKYPEEESVITMGVSIIKKRTIFTRIANLFRKKENRR